MTEVNGRLRLFTPHGIEDILGRDEGFSKTNKNFLERKVTSPEITLRRKKIRTTFTGRQIFELERMFERKKYLNAGERNSLSR